MGFYTIDHNGATTVKDGDKEKHLSYKRGEPIEDVKKGQLDHVKGAEYHSGSPKDEEKAKKK